MVAMYKGCVLSTCRLRKTKTTAQRTSAVSVPDTRWQVAASTHNHAWTEKLTPSQHFQAVPANCEWQFNTNLLLPRLFFGSPVFASNMSKDWIGLLPTRQQGPTFVFHSHMLRDSLKPRRFQALLPLHGQCAHWKKLHVSQKNTYPHCAASASEIATSQTTRKYKGTQGGQNPAWRSASTLSFAWITNFKSSLDKPLAAWEHRLICIFASTHPYIHVSLYPCIHESSTQKVQGAWLAFSKRARLRRAFFSAFFASRTAFFASSRFAFKPFNLSHNSSWQQTPEPWEMKCGKALL